MERFRDRVHAGELLADVLDARSGIDDGIVLGLPRGGVPVADRVAQRLGIPLDVFIVRKLGLPGHSEYAMGAIASGGVIVINEDAVTRLGITQEAIDTVAERELRELERREVLYRGDRPPLDLASRDVILVDDGIATGASMHAAIEAIKAYGPRSLLVAVPVAPLSAPSEFEGFVDAFIALSTPTPFQAVGLWYDDFTQTTDDEVRSLLSGD
ncbi:MAG: phosphoribosyltransferase [Actinomycetia bacterium]|nr:phosphoribosyltransferase [Actinomycetes bacterium]